MRRFWFVVVLAFMLLLPCIAVAEVTTLLNGVTSTGASSSVDTARARSVFIHVFSASTSSCTVKIQQSLDGTAWYDAATITDPSSTGELWSLESTAYTRVNVTARASGTITAKIEVTK